MALMNCIECGKVHSDTAIVCPHCGFTKEKEEERLNEMKELTRRRTGCLVLIIICILLYIFIRIVINKYTPEDSIHEKKVVSTIKKQEPTKLTKPNNHTNKNYLHERLNVGKFEYIIHSVNRTEQIGDLTPDIGSTFIIIDLSVKNNDSVSNIYVECFLIDQKEEQLYKTSAAVFLLKNNFTPIAYINSKATKRGRTVFEVPKNKASKLELVIFNGVRESELENKTYTQAKKFVTLKKRPS